MRNDTVICPQCHGKGTRSHRHFVMQDADLISPMVAAPFGFGPHGFRYEQDTQACSLCTGNKTIDVDVAEQYLNDHPIKSDWNISGIMVILATLVFVIAVCMYLW